MAPAQGLPKLKPKGKLFMFACLIVEVCVVISSLRLKLSIQILNL